MTGDAIHVTIIGKDAWDAKVAKIIAGLEDFRIPYKRTELYLEGRFAETFEKDGEPKWKELSPVTLMLRRGTSVKILQDTGRLKNTMSSGGRRGKAGSRRRIGKKRMEYGVSNNYKIAHYMQKGALVKNGWGRGIPIVIPPRPFMHFVPRDTPKIVKIFVNYIDALIV